MFIEMIKDSDIDNTLDSELRQLLSLCFSDEPLFKTQRYYKDQPSLRYLCRDKSLKIVGHVAVHHKCLVVDGREVQIAGIAEVCVHPDHRNMGITKKLLATIHQQLYNNSTPYSLLFGDKHVYQSSGYVKVENLIILSNKPPYSDWVRIPAMAKGICQQWPSESQVKLIGTTF